MALLPQPDLIIADEPTTALDVTIQAQVLRLLRALVKERGVSVLFTTHDLGTAHEICDRVVVMYAGQEMEAAPTDAFFGRPAHPYTQQLLASVPGPDGEIREIRGEVPSLVTPPSRCRFHPPCDYATAECRDQRPAPRALAADHGVRCHHPVDAPAAAGAKAPPPRRCWSWSPSRATSRCAAPPASASPAPAPPPDSDSRCDRPARRTP